MPLDTYLPMLVRAGQSVAICEQLEDPKQKQKKEYKPTEIITPPPTVEPKPAPEPVEPPTPEVKPQPQEIETEGGPDYNDNPDPRLFAYNLFGELEPLQKPKRQPRQPRTEEDKPKPTPKIEISDATAKKFRPLSEKELEFYGSLNWEDNPPINGFYETMMSIAHRQMAEMEAERQAAEATKKKIITENGTVIEKTEGYFVPQPRVAKVEKPETVERDMSPRKFSEDIQYFHQNGSMVVDNGQVGFLSEVRKNGAIFTPLPIKPEQEKRAMLYITLSETYQQLYHYEAETHEENADMREHLNEYYDEFVDRYGNLNEKQNAKFILMDANGRDALALERGENGHFVKADIFDHPVSFAVDEVTSVDTPMEALSASLNKYGEVNLEYMGSLVDMEQDAMIDSPRRTHFL